MPTQIRSEASHTDTIGAGKGSYVLLTHLPEEQTIAAGSLSPSLFARGYYAYVGSALGGFRSRLGRHLRTGKKPRWHIDYLLQHASLDAIVICETEHRTECVIAQTLAWQFKSVPSFGASDCRCRSHLFFATDDIMSSVIYTFKSIGLKPRLKYLRGQSSK